MSEHQWKTKPVIRGSVSFGSGAAFVYEESRKLMNRVYPALRNTAEWRDFWNGQASVWGLEYDPLVHSTPMRFRGGVHNCIGLH